MKRFITYICLVGLLIQSCSDFLERPPLDTIEDNATFWNSENNVRNQVIGLYSSYFEGYKAGWERSDFFDGNHVSEWTDDLAQQTATFFTLNVPANEAAVNGFNEGRWNFDKLRRINIIISRVGASNLEPERWNTPA